MDINILRALATLALFLAFVGICVVVFSRKRKAFYEQASRIPFDDQADSSDSDCSDEGRA